MITLVLGGARSGKSRFAEQLAEQISEKIAKPVTYIATAEPFDDGMKARIAKHQSERQQRNWQTLEAPTALAAAIKSVGDNNVLLVDCLTLWLNNLIYYQKTHEITPFLQAIDDNAETPRNVILVSNELGLGVLPADKASRAFIDQAGELNQQVASLADNVYFVVAGIAQKVK